MLTLTIGILITIVLGAILFWVIDRFCPRWPASAATQAVGGSGLLGVDRSPAASTAWLSVPSLGAPSVCVIYRGQEFDFAREAGFGAVEGLFRKRRVACGAAWLLSLKLMFPGIWVNSPIFEDRDVRRLGDGSSP